MCDACLESLTKKWVDGTPVADQPFFAAPDAKTCYFEPMMEGLNKWNIITLVSKKGEFEVDEINEVLQSAMDYKVSLELPQIEQGLFGIIECEPHVDAKDKALLVKWTCLPFALQEDTVIRGCGDEPMEAGTTVVEGIVYPYLSGNPYWFQRPKTTRSKKEVKELFWIQHVARGKVGVTKGQQGINMPTQNTTNITDWNRLQPQDLIKISDTIFQEIKDEIKTREQLNLIGWQRDANLEAVAKQLEKEAEDSEEEDEEEEDDDEDEEDNVSDDAYLAPSPSKQFVTPTRKRTRSQR